MSPQVPKSASTIYGPILDEERDPDILTLAQAFSTLQPQSIDRSPGDGDEGGIAVRSKAPPTTPPGPGLHSLTDRDARSREDRRTSVSTPPPTVDHSIREARNEGCHGNPIDRGDGAVQSGESGHKVGPGFSFPKGAPTFASELRSAGRGDRVVRPGDTPSTSFFQGSSNVQISGSPNFYDVRGNATIIRFGDGQFTDVQRNLICDYIANLTVLPDINNKLKKHVLTHSIISLPRAKAVFDDYQNKKSGPCFKGTREALLREMAEWATTSSEATMYILSGLAGIGKSTVAYTIASRAADLNLLGASFFFSRDEADRKNAEFFFTTIAYQLCVYNETFAKAIGDVLLTERGSAATTKDPHDQLQALILEPLRSIDQSRSRPILIVVDALDECDEEEAFSVLTALSQLVRDLSSFKIILTSRPQPYLNEFLISRDGHKIFRLQDIEDRIVDDDVRLYLNYSLSLEQIQKRYPRRQWCASDQEVDALVRAAGRLFIIASTAVRYILDKSASNPAAQMQKLLLASAQDRTPFKDLAHFYTIILRNVVPENCDNDDTVIRYQSVVGAIICVQRPLSVSTLAHLIKVNEVEILEVLDNLQSVISLGSDDAPLIYHKSFPDYLTDQARCKDSCLQIDTRICHIKMVTCCFEIMDKHLKRNILGLGEAARFMSNEDGLKADGITDEQIQERIPQQLGYACVYWVKHLEVANVEDEGLMNGLERFAHEHLLYWLEVLSLIGKLDLAYRAIDVVLKLLTSASSELHQLLSDALRFFSNFYEIIKRSALHTYYSALPFTPTDSLLYRRYIKEAVHNVCSIEGGPEKWDPLVANMRHEEDVDVVKFSLDSTLLVSYSKESVDDDGKYHRGKLKIWDAVTGTLISTIPGHMFAVANDFSTVASFQGNTATIYNVNGSPSGTVFTAPSTIRTLALSERSRVAAALSDGTVLLWDTGNAKLIDSGECERYWQLEFSPTGARLASLSANSIKLRDGINGRFVADLRCDSSSRFKFSGDGSRIAFVTFNNSLTLWDSESGGLIAAVSCLGQNSFAISANGSLLATTAYSRDKVTLWSDSLAKMKVLEVDRYRSMAFSLDNILAIATGDDVKLYNVKTHSIIHTLPLRRKPYKSIALGFSPDCTRLAVQHDNCNVNLWDIRGIDASSPPLKRNDATGVTALALSRDCLQLACMLGNGTVELWGTSPTMRRISIDSAPHSKPTLHWGVDALEFDPDGGLFASGSNGTIKLWNGGDGVLRGTLEVSIALEALALSNSMLVAVYDGGVALWSLDTLTPIHTFKTSNDNYDIAPKVSIAENSTLIAVSHWRASTLFDVVNRAIIRTFDVPSHIRTMTFLPDNSQLVVQSDEGDFQSFDLINNRTTEGPKLEHLVQLPNTPLWHGIPVWHCKEKKQHYFAALFPQHKSSVPVLWIPKHITVRAWTQGSSMIALGCKDGRIILLRLPTSHVS